MRGLILPVDARRAMTITIRSDPDHGHVWAGYRFSGEGVYPPVQLGSGGERVIPTMIAQSKSMAESDGVSLG